MPQAEEGLTLKNRIGNKARRLLLVLLAVLLLGGIALAADGDISLSLYRRHAKDGTPFQVGNMFPGDTETKSYYITTSYTGVVTVHFHADIRDGYEKLAEVLKCRVALRDGDVLYDGLMRDMPQSLDHALPRAEKGSATLIYDITTYLDTDVGNEYMSKALCADFNWWVSADGASGRLTPKTGDDSHALVWAALAALSLGGVLLLMKKRRGGAA